MTKRHDSPQNVLVDVKTYKDSHYHSNEHTETAGRQNEAYMPTTEEVESCWESKGDIGNPYETEADWLKSRRLKKLAFKKWLRKMKAAAWDEGREAGEDYGMSISDGNHDDELLRNPYESEES